jgi:hypothetical protein
VRSVYRRRFMDMGVLTVVQENAGGQRCAKPVFARGVEDDLTRVDECVGCFQWGQGPCDNFVLSGGGFGVIHLELDSGELKAVGNLFEDFGFEGPGREGWGVGPAVGVDWLDGRGCFEEDEFGFEADEEGDA